jgi:hypothetical protein
VPVWRVVGGPPILPIPGEAIDVVLVQSVLSHNPALSGHYLSYHQRPANESIYLDSLRFPGFFLITPNCPSFLFLLPLLILRYLIRSYQEPFTMRVAGVPFATLVTLLAAGLSEAQYLISELSFGHAGK